MKDVVQRQNGRWKVVYKVVMKKLMYRQGFIYWGVGEKLLPQTQYLPPQNIIINRLLYMFLFHFNIDFLGSDFIRGAF